MMSDYLAKSEVQNREIAMMLMEQQESDRGCVIFGAAMLEDELESLLRGCCRTDMGTVKKVVDPLFRGYAPFSTFSAKIQVSYAFGFIPKQVYKTLDLVRKLRNDFAHEKSAVSFQSAKYESRLRAIIDSVEKRDAPSKRKLHPDDDEKITHMGRITKRQFVERLVFCLCVADTIARIQVASDFISSSLMPGKRTKPIP